MKKLIHLSFLPSSPDCGLLLLRAWLGLSMLLLHGKAKLVGFTAQLDKFQDMGIHPALGSAAILAESVCAFMLIIGLFTRLSALFLIATMSFAFFQVHKMALSGPGSGELAFIYLGGFLAVLLAGPGRLSLDSRVIK
jgi:putative oxidoreductase